MRVGAASNTELAQLLVKLIVPSGLESMWHMHHSTLRATNTRVGHNTMQAQDWDMLYKVACCFAAG